MAKENVKETKETAAVTEKPQSKGLDLMERVPVFIPRGGGDKIVGVNGKNYQLPEGKTSYVPRFVAMEIERAGYAVEKFYADATAHQNVN